MSARLSPITLSPSHSASVSPISIGSLLQRIHRHNPSPIFLQGEELQRSLEEYRESLIPTSAHRYSSLLLGRCASAPPILPSKNSSGSSFPRIRERSLLQRIHRPLVSKNPTQEELQKSLEEYKVSLL